MNQPCNDPNQTELASGFTVADYKSAVERQDRDKIADAIRHRFTERYIEPVTSSDGKKIHGFTIMAVSCLMIESLESFRQGWVNSGGKGMGQLAFCGFFDCHTEFECFRGYSAKFYKNVRCGILHQAETTGGWKITQRETVSLFVPDPLPTINATLFLQNLHTVLDSYCDMLKVADWGSEEWQNVRKKMDALCKHCCP
jgi:hypothetical protein